MSSLVHRVSRTATLGMHSLKSVDSHSPAHLIPSIAGTLALAQPFLAEFAVNIVGNAARLPLYDKD